MLFGWSAVTAARGVAESSLKRRRWQSCGEGRERVSGLRLELCAWDTRGRSWGGTYAVCEAVWGLADGQTVLHEDQVHVRHHGGCEEVFLLLSVPIFSITRRLQ
jgi:hypothetical protein